MQTKTTMQRAKLSSSDYQAFRKFLEEACGIVLGTDKEYLVSSRLGGLMGEFAITSYSDLVSQLQSGRNSRLKTSIIDAMTTNETFWFRDMAHYRMLEEKILPELTAKRSGQRTRIWSAACSSGQEPYNISMILQDFQARNPGKLSASTEVVATDISTAVLADAKTGVYTGMAASRGMSAEQQHRYFTEKNDALEVKAEIKRRVSFRELNLTKGYELLGRFDIIFCRNVLIYFSHDQKSDIINRMARALNPEGYLFLGSTESLSAHSDRFEMFSALGGICYRLKS